MHAGGLPLAACGYPCDGTPLPSPRSFLQQRVHRTACSSSLPSARLCRGRALHQLFLSTSSNLCTLRTVAMRQRLDAVPVAYGMQARRHKARPILFALGLEPPRLLPAGVHRCHEPCRRPPRSPPPAPAAHAPTLRPRLEPTQCRLCACFKAPG